jgi:hypothetical protein
MFHQGQKGGATLMLYWLVQIHLKNTREQH